MPGGIIAPFASKNYYGSTVLQLKNLTRRFCEDFGFRRREFRIFSNSRFPEKAMAAAAGLGFIGKNTLLITPEYGSSILISGVILPWMPEGGKEPAEQRVKRKSCGTCRLCLEACPGKALDGTGRLDPGSASKPCPQTNSPRRISASGE